MKLIVGIRINRIIELMELKVNEQNYRSAGKVTHQGFAATNNILQIIFSDNQGGNRYSNHLNFNSKSRWHFGRGPKKIHRKRCAANNKLNEIA